MKFKCLLLFASSVLLVDGLPSISAPVQVVTPNRTSLLVAAANPDQTCKLKAAAVVTIYAGSEIGSGSIISPDGMVITNHHVVKQIVSSRGSKPIYVKLADGDRFTGKLVKTDTKNDLALVKLNAQQSFPTVPLANLDSVQPGQPVCAIGSPFGRPGVLTQGTLQGTRGNGDLRSNVLLKPGNSGGPLLNARGELIGVNKSILEDASGRNTGISFATSVLAAKNFLAQNGVQLAASSTSQAQTAIPLPATPRSTASVAQQPVPKTSTFSVQSVPIPVPSASRSTAGAHLGVRIDSHNLVVRQVESGSPAALGGLRPGDRLVAINGAQLAGFDQLQAFLNRRPSSAVFTIRRDQQVATVRVSF